MPGVVGRTQYSEWYVYVRTLDGELLLPIPFYIRVHLVQVIESKGKDTAETLSADSIRVSVLVRTFPPSGIKLSQR